jgi:L,D-transpeptidase ErfK/SrfK
MFLRITVENIYLNNVTPNKVPWPLFNCWPSTFRVMACICTILFCILFPSVSLSSIFIGGEVVYKVKEGDTLQLIGAKLGVDWRNLLEENNIDDKQVLSIGQEIRTNTRKIVPKIINDGIIINIPDRMLYYFKNGTLQSAFPVGLGRRSWKTPPGRFRVVYKEEDPIWYVPKSVQMEMLGKGEPVKFIVLPGSQNPLGRYAVTISIPGILIHETIWPSSVYQFRSHGCIRVLARDMEKFFKDVEIDNTGEIIYSPLKIAISDSGRIFFEVHRDVYKKVMDMNAEARRLIESKGLSDRVNWQKVNQMLNEKSGVAEDITL